MVRTLMFVRSFLVLITTWRRPLWLEALRYFWSRTSRYAWTTARLLREDIYTLDTFYKLGNTFTLRLQNERTGAASLLARFNQALAAIPKRPLSDLLYRGRLATTSDSSGRPG